MMSKKTIIYILPHHDDELFVVPKITNDRLAGHLIKFFFLTQSTSRLAETRTFLVRLGVKGEDIVSIGEKLGIADGEVHLGIDEIYNEINSQLKMISYTHIDEVVCTAYEGGHNDHDIASILARALARKYNSSVLEFYLYNGYGTKGKFYNVASAVNLSSNIHYRYYGRDFLAVLSAPFIYLSQIKAMLGLWPFLLIKIIANKPLIITVLSKHQLEIDAHVEIPLYERWGRIEQKDLLIIVLNFLKRNELLKDKGK